MDIRTIFFDVDGTLVDPKTHTIPQSAIDTIKKLQSMGYLCCIATGRIYQDTKTTIAFNAVDWDGYVCCNGQEVLDKNHNYIYQEAFTCDKAKEVIEVANRLGHPMCAMTNGDWFMTQEADDNCRETMAVLKMKIPDVVEYTNQQVLAFILFADRGYDYKPYMDIEGLRINPSYFPYADVGIFGTSKAKAIEIFLNHHGLEGYIAFGDSMNDYDMLKCANVSIAMGQGDPRIQEIASFVTQAVDDDGILYAFENCECFKNKD